MEIESIHGVKIVTDDNAIYLKLPNGEEVVLDFTYPEIPQVNVYPNQENYRESEGCPVILKFIGEGKVELFDDEKVII